MASILAEDETNWGLGVELTEREEADLSSKTGADLGL